jgi:hypothetical protein
VRICATLTDVKTSAGVMNLSAEKVGKKMLKNRGFPLSLHKIFKIFCRNLSIPEMELRFSCRNLLNFSTKNLISRNSNLISRKSENLVLNQKI